MDERIYHTLGLDPALASPELQSMLEFFADTAEKKLRLKAGLSSDAVIPAELGFIIPEYVIKRYNRVGSEGYKSHTVEGESISFEDDDFSEFEDAINTWLESQESSAKGKVRFL